jgi:hypothetical protein
METFECDCGGKDFNISVRDGKVAQVICVQCQWDHMRDKILEEEPSNIDLYLVIGGILAIGGAFGFVGGLLF